MLELKVTAVGNSLGVVLPREAPARMKLAKGDTLFLRLASGELGEDDLARWIEANSRPAG